MKFLGMGVPELVVILVIVLLIFGPKNLPKLGSAIGKSVKGLREGMSGADEKAEEGDEVVVEKVEELDSPVEEAPKVKRVVKKKAEVD